MNYTYKQIFFINFPVLMSILVEQLINITDAIFLSHVGEVELGASAIASIYYLAIYMFGFGFSMGLQVMIARKNGEQKQMETGKIFFQGLYFLFILSILLLLFTRLLSPFIMQELIHSDDVYIAVQEYINWRCLGLLFAFPFLAFRSFFVAITNTRILVISSISMIVTNIALNYILIFGKGGFPALGISGAAIASTVSEAVSLLIIVLYIHLRIDKHHYGLKFIYDGKILVKLFHLSIWSMFHSFIGVAPWLLFFIMIEHLGKSQLAIANIVRSISTIFFVIVSSFSTTAGSLVSNLIGAGKRKDIMSLSRKIIKLAYIIGIPLIVLAFLFMKQVLNIYTRNDILIKEAYWTYVIMLSNYFLAVPAYVYCNAITGMGNTRTTFIFQVITISLYLVYLCTLSTLSDIPLAIYWFAESLFVIILFYLSYSYLRKIRKT